MDAEHAVERVRGLMDEGFGVVGIGMEIFEGQVAIVARLLEGFHDRGPVRRSIEQRPEGLE